MTNDTLGDRMKVYEMAARTTLIRRMPVLMRIDGKAFHTWTAGLKRPFDLKFVDAMNNVAISLCEKVEGTVLAYVQSDEISLLLHNYKRLQTQPWFDNQVQKMVSVGASIASATMTLESGKLFDSGMGANYRSAYFDARVFLLPEAEVTNYFLWRQQDACRNSIQMLARSLYSHKELDRKNTSELNEMCHVKGHNWNDLATHLRRGRCIVKIEEDHDGVMRSKWAVDNDVPLFNRDRDYIERCLAVLPEYDVAVINLDGVTKLEIKTTEES